MPPSYILFLKKKQKTKKKKKKYVGVAGHPIFAWEWFGFLFLNFFKKIYICDGGILGKKKNVKMVELQQFESLEGLSVTFETLKVKV